MAKINFEALTIVNLDFVKFDETIDLLVVDGSAEGGFHLQSKGVGIYDNGGYCDGDFNEYHLKVGRIALMEIGEEWHCNHNNWYGYNEYIKVIKKETFTDGRTFITLEWVREVVSKKEEYEYITQIIISVDTEELNKYRTKHNFLHHFVYEMVKIEYDIEYRNYLHTIEELEEIEDLEELEEVEWE